MSVELRVIANKTNAEDIEITQFEAGITFEAHLRAIMPDYEPRPVPLFSALLNGNEFLPQDWGKTTLKNGDVIICTAEPKEPTTIALVVIAVVSAAAAIYYANQNIPDNYNTTTPSGSSIYDANAQGNRPKLMGAVPELFGTHKVFPDYVVPPRKQFIDNDEYFFALMSITRGQVELSAQNIFIGNTPITSFGNDVWAHVFEPGANVSGHPAHLLVYSSPEVGGFDLLGSKTWVEYHYPSNQTGAYITAQRATAANALREFEQYAADNGYGDTVYLQRTNKLKDVSPGQYIEIIDVTNWAELNNSIFRVVRHYQESDGRWATELDAVDIDLVSLGVSNPFAHMAVDELTELDYRVIEADGAGDRVGPFKAVPSGETTDKIYLDFRFPQGLCRIDNDGNPQTHTVEIRVVINFPGIASPQTEVFWFTNNSVDEQGFTEIINVPAGSSPEIWIYRYTKDYDDLKYKDLCTWTAMRAEMPSQTTYPDVTTLAIRIKGTNALSAASENKISCVPTRKLRHFNSSGSLAFGPTNDLSAAILHTWTDAGNADDSIDMDELWRLHQIWKARGDEFHAVFDNETTVWDAIKRQMAVGFTEPTLEFGQLVPVRDEPQPNINYMYQPDNIIPKSFKMSATMFDESEPDGVEVEYMSSETWKPETILCTLPGEYGLKPEKVRAFGVTSRDKAYQFGMRKRCALRYRRISYEFSTEMDGLNSRYLSPDAVGIDMMGFSQTGRVESVSGRTLTLNADLQWETGTHYIGLRRPDGSMSGPYVCTQGAQSDQVVLATDLDFVPRIDGTQEPPLFMFGSADRMCERVLIQEIDPQGTERVKLKAVNYDERVFDYDDAPAPS